MHSRKIRCDLRIEDVAIGSGFVAREETPCSLSGAVASAAASELIVEGLVRRCSLSIRRTVSRATPECRASSGCVICAAAR